MPRPTSPHHLRLLVGASALLLACNRPPNADWDDNEFGTGVDIPEDADVSPSCGDNISQEGEFCLVLLESPEAGIDPCDLDVIDFDKDGLPDLAVPNSDPNITNDQYVANFMMGNGQSVGAAAAFPAGGPLPVRSAAGDFDGDGNADFAVSNHEEHAVNVLFGDGNGHFEKGAPIACGGVTGDLAAGDLDGDGRDELVVVLDGQSRVEVYKGGQHGGAEALELDLAPTDVETTDFDGDGRDEIILPTSDAIEVYTRLGANTYQQRWAPGCPFGATGVKAGDLDNDGDDDLVAFSMAGDLGVFEYQGGELSHAYWTTFNASFRDAAIANFDAMARNDIALTDVWTNHVRFYRLGSDDGYHEFADRFTGNYPVAVVTADFNGDGHPDLATADQFSDRLSIFVNMP